jgi:DNA-3-methyladenine glycosylase
VSAPATAARRLGREFFARPALEVAPDLIGCTLLFDGVGGTIVETEAYDESEPACHAYVGRTARTAVLFGPPAHAYVYLSYGIHQLFNFVCDAEGHGAAVLVRAIEPHEGVHEMWARRPAARERGGLCSGPGKLAQALAIGPEHNGRSVLAPPFEVLARTGQPPAIVAGPRIGITKAAELPWRFLAAGNPYTS